MSDPIELDIVIPVYNESDNIKQVLDGLRTQVKTPFRVLICYDFDQDNTLPAVKEYVAAQPINIDLVKNQSKGVLGAVLSGFAASKTDAVLVFPADDTFNGGIIDKMMSKFREGYDIVAASRFIPGGCMKDCPLLKAVLARVAAWMLYYLASVPTHDPTNGLKLFSRKMLNQMAVESTCGWSFALELVVKAQRKGLKIAEVPALWYGRVKGQSRFKVLEWLPFYMRWFNYAFATTYLRKPWDESKETMIHSLEVKDR